MIYFTSDPHFCHNRQFLYGPRGFKTVDEMNEAIVERINSVVTNIDDLYILGDMMLNDNDKGMEYLRRLNGHVHFLRGNHDTDNKIEMYKYLPHLAGNPGLWSTTLKYRDYHFYLSHYPALCSCADDKPLTTKTICLCGHSHTQDKFKDFDKGLIYHVELDAHDCYPVSIDTIINDIKEKLKEA